VPKNLIGEEVSFPFADRTLSNALFTLSTPAHPSRTRPRVPLRVLVHRMPSHPHLHPRSRPHAPSPESVRLALTPSTSTSTSPSPLCRHERAASVAPSLTRASLISASHTSSSGSPASARRACSVPSAILVPEELRMLPSRIPRTVSCTACSR